MTDPAITHFPTPISQDKLDVPSLQKIDAIEKHLAEVLKILGLDLENESLAKTPRRVAEMFVDDIFSGLNPKNFPEIALESEEPLSKQMVLIKDITLISFCEHHLVPMVGKAHVAYVPKSQIIGLSKINRIVRYFAKRPQLQERLSAQIADSLVQLLKTEDVAVCVHAKHFCVCARGVQDLESETQTSVLRGGFESNPSLRHEFFTSLHLQDQK